MTRTPVSKQWDEFFCKAKDSGMFRGGSALGTCGLISKNNEERHESAIIGFMRFEADSFAKFSGLLEYHPIVVNGGTVEIRELINS